MAGLRLPIESHVLQAFVSEGVKPLIHHVITFGAGHFYISQSDKGGLVFGGDIDGYNSYAQRGNLPVIEDVCEGGMALMPMLGRLRVCAAGAACMDMSMDGSPIIDRTPVDGLYLNAGWCYGGFKATPASGWCFAHLIARDEPHPVAAAYRLDRFATGPADRRARRGRAAEPALRSTDADPAAHHCGERDVREFVYLGDATVQRPDPQARRRARAVHDLRLPARQPGRSAPRALVPRRRCQAWLVVDARHAHARDRRRRTGVPLCTAPSSA